MKLNFKVILFLAVAAAAGIFFLSHRSKPAANESIREVHASMGTIEKSISATAVVQPQNRIEMKPPIAGRLEKILAREGQQVKAGEVVVTMSSTERAALLDAAQAKGEAEMDYWRDIYKPIVLIAPIDGTVIVSTMQPGQTVAQADPVIVLSDRLIVQAQVDETDIGKVREGQKAVITLDAYPSIRVEATVNHIYYESKVVNNVTIYQVDLLPQEVPDVFRSGMSANVRIIEEQKSDILVLPLEAVKHDKRESFVWISGGKTAKPSKQPVETGISDDENIEILSGVSESDTVVIPSQKYTPAKETKGSNPFAPGGPRRSRSNATSAPSR